MGQIQIDKVTRRYLAGDQYQTVLQEAELLIESGGFCALSGPSGSGKSTLLNLIGGIDSPDEGRILVEGEDLNSKDDAALARFRARHIGFIFQSFHLIPVLTAVENVAWPLYFQGIPSKERQKFALEMLERVGLADYADRQPKKLSGGQQQRVAIARALVGNPSVVLADEPTANLDRKTSEEIMNLLQELNQDQSITLIAATHDPLVVKFATRHLQLENYKIVDEVV